MSDNPEKPKEIVPVIQIVEMKRKSFPGQFVQQINREQGRPMIGKAKQIIDFLILDDLYAATDNIERQIEERDEMENRLQGRESSDELFALREELLLSLRLGDEPRSIKEKVFCRQFRATFNHPVIKINMACQDSERVFREIPQEIEHHQGSATDCRRRVA